MGDQFSADILSAVNDIRELLRLLAEPAIAQRDKKLRSELRRIVGTSPQKAKAVFLMDGSRTQAIIQRESRINQGNLSRLVKQLNVAKLLLGNGKVPKRSISLPVDFFEGDAESE